jgi:hypothetical protein
VGAVIKINIATDFADVYKMLDGIARDLQPKIVARSLNAIGETVKVQARKEIGAEYNLPATEIGKLIRVQRASFRAGGRLEVAVIAESRRGGRSLNIIRFVEKKVTLAEARRRRKGDTLDSLRVQIKRKGGKKILGKPKWAAGKPFIVTANGGTFVAARTTSASYPIRAVQTIDVPSMFNTKRINALLLGTIRAKFPAAFKREFDAAFELSQCVLERQLAVLESIDDGLELAERLLEIDGLGFSGGHVALRWGAQDLHRGPERVNAVETAIPDSTSRGAPHRLVTLTLAAIRFRLRCN